MKIFKDRISAGKILAEHLKQYKDLENGIVLGIPRGGVVIAAEVAKELDLPLDIIVTRKIGALNQPELALGAVDGDGQIVGEVGDVGGDLPARSAGGPAGRQVRGGIIEREIGEIKRREELYRSRREPLEVSEKTVILIDDGIATGATTLAAINYLKRHQAKKIILAVPVASTEAKMKLFKEVDELIILETPQYFQAVGQFYQNFEPVEDQEVIQLLK